MECKWWQTWQLVSLLIISTSIFLGPVTTCLQVLVTKSLQVYVTTISKSLWPLSPGPCDHIFPGPRDQYLKVSTTNYLKVPVTIVFRNIMYISPSNIDKNLSTSKHSKACLYTWHFCAIIAIKVNFYTISIFSLSLAS
jgi:hypothetical protein